MTLNNEPATIVALGVRADRLTVYNLTVNRLNNYSVGRVGALVHNRCKTPLRQSLEKAGYKAKANEQAAHIVPKGSWQSTNRSLEVKQAIRNSQGVLAKKNISLDSHWNGFNAPKGHFGTHTNKYFLDMGERLGRVGNSSRAHVIRELKHIRYDILMGKYL